MFTIITGHILEFISPLFIFKDIKITPSDFGGKALTYLAFLGLLLFIEYQVFRSIKYGKLYWRGSIDKLDGSKFKTCQFTYSTLGGFIIIIFLQNIL